MRCKYLPETPPYNLFILCKSQPYTCLLQLPLAPKDLFSSPQASISRLLKARLLKLFQSEQCWIQQPGGRGYDSGLLISIPVLPSGLEALIASSSWQTWGQISPAVRGMESSVQLACPGGRGSSGTGITLGCIMPLTHFFLVRLAQATTCRMKDPGTMVLSGVQEC